jgi:hypothetical protein
MVRAEDLAPLMTRPNRWTFKRLNPELAGVSDVVVSVDEGFYAHPRNFGYMGRIDHHLYRRDGDRFFAVAQGESSGLYARFPAVTLAARPEEALYVAVETLNTPVGDGQDGGVFALPLIAYYTDLALADSPEVQVLPESTPEVSLVSVTAPGVASSLDGERGKLRAVGWLLISAGNGRFQTQLPVFLYK